MDCRNRKYRDVLYAQRYGISEDSGHRQVGYNASLSHTGIAMHPMVNIAVRAARRAGDMTLRYLDRGPRLDVGTKGLNDFVTEVDHKCEAAIIETIHAAYPAHGILAEETGRHGGGDYLWVIDPLDGTTNFLHGFPQFAVSIAL